MASLAGPGGARRPTIDDVARLAGVSKGSVSFAFNGRPGVGEETRQRIFDAAAALDWRPSASAKALSVGKSMAIGLIMTKPPELIGTDPFFGLLLAGIEESLAPAGYVLVVGAVTEANERDAYERLVADGRVDGMLLTDVRRDDPRFDLVAKAGVPTVLVGHGGPDRPLPKVRADEAPAIAQAVGHLVELGHREIAHVSGTPGLAHAETRRAAWRRAVKGAGLAPGASLTGRFTADGAESATLRLLEGSNPPTAIFYASDLMAVGGMRAAVGLGLSIPADLSIIGFDDMPLAEYLSPSLSTIRQDPETAGRVAAAILLAQISGDPLPLIEVPVPVYIPRGSTSRPPAGSG